MSRSLADGGGDFSREGRYRPIEVAGLTYIETAGESPVPTYYAKASRTQLPDIPLRSDTQALRLIARISLIQRREKCPSREEKSTFT